MAAAGVIAAASFVMGLAGFGIALVALAFLPYLMAPAHAIILLTIYTVVFSAALLVQLRRDVDPRAIADLLVGTVVGTPIGVWGLAALPAGVLNRLIGLMLVVAFVLETRRLYPERLRGPPLGARRRHPGRRLGGAVGTPGPPVVLYAATQGWSARAIKANLQAFFVVNQGAILAGLLVGRAPHARGLEPGRWASRCRAFAGGARGRAPVRARGPSPLPSDRLRGDPGLGARAARPRLTAGTAQRDCAAFHCATLPSICRA